MVISLEAIYIKNYSRGGAGPGKVPNQLFM